MVRSNRCWYRQDVIGAPARRLNVPPIPASNFVLGERRASSRDDGTPSWEALEEIWIEPSATQRLDRSLEGFGHRDSHRPD